MAASYKKLWKLLIDRDMKKKDLRMLTRLSSSTIAKMTKNEPVSTDVIRSRSYIKKNRYLWKHFSAFANISTAI